MPDRLAYTVKEVVALTAISRASIYREIANGNLTARKRGSSTFILAEDLEAYLRQLPTVGASTSD